MKRPGIGRANEFNNFLFRANPIRSLLQRLAGKFTARKPTPALAVPVATTGKKILLVDDDPIILKTTSMKLQSHGYAVITATDGAGAIHAVRTEKPHLVLLDVNFPADAGGGSVSWDGLLIISWLRRFGELHNIPFIIITGGDPAKYKERSLATGAMAFFHKPLDHDGLLSLIDQTVVKDAASP
jgi:two-component system response regulator GlrR